MRQYALRKIRWCLTGGQHDCLNTIISLRSTWALAISAPPSSTLRSARMLRVPGHARYDHSNITQRPDYNWPGGKRLAFYIALNIEHFAFGTGIGMDPAHRGGAQTTRNYAWRDYGNRVGNWRLFEIL